METGHTRDGPTNTRGGPTKGKGPRRMSDQTANPCNIGEDPQSIPGNDNAVHFCNAILWTLQSREFKLRPPAAAEPGPQGIFPFNPQPLLPNPGQIGWIG